jgi:hypothetical protein
MSLDLAIDHICLTLLPDLVWDICRWVYFLDMMRPAADPSKDGQAKIDPVAEPATTSPAPTLTATSEVYLQGIDKIFIRVVGFDIMLLQNPLVTPNASPLSEVRGPVRGIILQTTLGWLVPARSRSPNKAKARRISSASMPAVGSTLFN